jgi:O-antigen/teichoic acid export membrane protein
MTGGLARSGLVTLLGAAFGSLMGLLLSLVVGRGLGDEGAGVFYASIAVFTIAANVLELGADTGLVRMLARYRAIGRRDRLARTVVVAMLPVLVVAGVVLGLTYVLWPYVAALIGHAVATSLRGALPCAAAAAALAVVLGGSRGLGYVLPFTMLWNVALPAVRPVLVGLAVVLGLGVVGAVQLWAWAVLPVLAVALVVLTKGLRSHRDTAPGRTAEPLGPVASEFWRFAGPRGVSAAVEITLSWLSVVLVASLRGPADAGVYAVVSRCVTAGLVVEAAARVAVAPRLSGLLAQEARNAAGDLQSQATRAMILLSWPFYITLAAFGPTIQALFGPSFRSGALSLAVLSAAMMLLVAAGTVQTVLLMSGLSLVQLANKLIALVVLVLGNLLLVPEHGAVGAALAWAAAIAVDTLLAAHQVRSSLSVPLRWREQVPPALIAVTVWAGTALLVRATAGEGLGGLVVHLLSASALYAVTCWCFRDRLGITGHGLSPRRQPQNI